MINLEKCALYVALSMIILKGTMLMNGASYDAIVREQEKCRILCR